VQDTDPPTTLALDAAIAARAHLVDEAHRTAFRLFNGHLEGDPRFVIDAFGTTAVIFHHGTSSADLRSTLRRLRERSPWLDAIVVKERQGATDEARRGQVAWRRTGAAGVDTSIVEHGVRYAVDLLLNQDAGFYLDTRLLRRWLIDHAGGKMVLNTFAYTGSLGVAARAGGATRVLNTDLNARFLEAAKASFELNGFDVDAKDFRAQDFFSLARGLKLQDQRFDIVVLDPPFFSSTRGGSVELGRSITPLINKVRPLVRSGGTLVVVNNALYVSGAAFLGELEALGAGGWVTIEGTLDVPEDVVGYPTTRSGDVPVDPAPFNHATKIALLGIRHRDPLDASSRRGEGIA
jgi:23S rRNA (cytosine1962-C5)-methyltransferase